MVVGIHTNGWAEDRIAPPQVPTIDFVRGLQHEASIPEVRRLGASIGYVRIQFFGRRTAAQLHRILARFQADGVRAIMIDLRNNEGGYLRSAIQALDCFFSPGITLLWEVDRDGRRLPYVSKDAEAWTAPVAVLINARSASSAEAFAASLRFYRKAFLAGGSTFGKGTVQTLSALPSHKRRIATIGLYVLPDGRSIDGIGLTPDVDVPPGQDPVAWAAQRLKEAIVPSP